MDPINVQLFKPDSGRPDEWYVRWTNGTSADSPRLNYQVQAKMRESDGQLTILYPYYDASYTREGVAALILDEDGNLVINKQWYVYNTSTNQHVTTLYTPGAILNDELFLLNGGSFAGLTGCENNTGIGDSGVVNLYQNGVSFAVNYCCRNGNGDGPGVWTDHGDVAFISGGIGNGCRIGTIRRDQASAYYSATGSFRDGGTIIFPETDQYIQGRKRFRATSDWNSVHLASGTCDGITGLPLSQTNSLFYRTGPNSYQISTGYSFGPDTATNCFRDQVGGTYYTIAFSSVSDPWGTPVIRNSGKAYSFGYNTQSVSNYGAVHLPDAYSSFQGLWVSSCYTSTPGYIILVSDDYYITDIAQWHYTYNGTALPWYLYPDPSSYEHVILAYKSGQECHVMRLHYSSLINGLGFSSGSITATTPANPFIRYTGFADQGSLTMNMTGSSTATPSSPGSSGIPMITPIIDHFQVDTD